MHFFGTGRIVFPNSYGMRLHSVISTNLWIVYSWSLSLPLATPATSITSPVSTLHSRISISTHSHSISTHGVGIKALSLSLHSMLHICHIFVCLVRLVDAKSTHWCNMNFKRSWSLGDIGFATSLQESNPLWGVILLQAFEI